MAVPAGTSAYGVVRNLSMVYGELQVLHGLSFDIFHGELLGFVGPSGSGKSTMLRLLAGIETPTAGRVSYSPPPGPRHPVILVFQDYLLFPHMTAFDNVAFGLRSTKKHRRLSRAEIRTRVSSYLDELGVLDKAASYPAQLSGGQQQRVALARALVMEPRLLLLDEPFASLDTELKFETASFLRSVQQRFALSMVVVSHDVEELASVADRLGVFRRGAIVELDTPDHISWS